MFYVNCRPSPMITRISKASGLPVVSFEKRGSMYTEFYSMIDCHAHLVDNKFAADIDEVIGKSISADVTRAVVVPEYPSQFQKVLDLRRRHPDYVIAAIGVHPIRKNRKSVWLSEAEAAVAFICQHQEVVGCVGEIGLDFTTSQFKIVESDFEEQRRAMRIQCEAAKQFGLAVNVHSRSAESSTLDVLEECSVDRVLMHAFGGSPSEVCRGVSAGYYFSIPPAFGVDDKCASLVQAVPLSQLCLETDSPVLGPTRERNEPANCSFSAAFIARVKDVEEREVRLQTTHNANKLFGLE